MIQIQIEQLSWGSEAFRDSIREASPAQRARVRRLADWADELALAGLADLRSATGDAPHWELHLRPPGEPTALVRLRHDRAASIALHPSQFARRAPQCLALLRRLGHRFDGATWITIEDWTNADLAVLAAAFEEARLLPEDFAPTLTDLRLTVDMHGLP